jgi:uridylate kinase
MSNIKYKRVLLKVSGEALAGGAGRGLDFDVINDVCDVVAQCIREGVQVGIVVGGGNFWRGLKDGRGMNERTRADHMGMLATTINCLALADILEQKGVDVRVQTAIEMRAIAEPYIRSRAIRHLEKGRVVIFGCGTGNPYFSTDTAAVLRGAEIEADAVLMAKNIDGVYSADPNKDKNAVKYDELTYTEMITKELGAIDLTAAAFCMANNITTYAFELKDPMNIYRVAMGKKIGTELHK